MKTKQNLWAYKPRLKPLPETPTKPTAESLTVNISAKASSIPGFQKPEREIEKWGYGQKGW